jgi:hypothetical protein
METCFSTRPLEMCLHVTIQIQTFMPQVGFEPTIAVSERAKTVHASDCAATVIGSATHSEFNKPCILV